MTNPIQPEMLLQPTNGSTFNKQKNRQKREEASAVTRRVQADEDTLNLTGEREERPPLTAVQPGPYSPTANHRRRQYNTHSIHRGTLRSPVPKSIAGESEAQPLQRLIKAHSGEKK